MYKYLDKVNSPKDIKNMSLVLYRMIGKLKK